MKIANERCPVGAPNFKTESEKLFAEYLDGNGFAGQWDYEPEMPESSKRPDFLLELGPKRFLFEVKQRKGRYFAPGFACFDPTRGISETIQDARPQLGDDHDLPSSLVLYNCSDINTPMHYTHVFETMLGPLKLTWQYNSQTREHVSQSENLLFDSTDPIPGEMIDPHCKGEFQNTIFSAIIVLERTSLIDHAAEKKAEEAREHAMCGRSDEFSVRSGAEAAALAIATANCPPVTRCVICENPGARIPLPRNLFVGPFDERWAMEDGLLKQIYVGDRVGDVGESINHHREFDPKTDAWALYQELVTEIIHGTRLSPHLTKEGVEGGSS